MAGPNHSPISIDADAALDRFVRLTAIEGKSGNEAGVAAAIRDELIAAGVDASNIHVDDAHTRTMPLDADGSMGNQGNLIVHLPGTDSTGGDATGRDSTGDGSPRTMLSAHMDTVPICVGSKPVRRRHDGPHADRIESDDPATGLGADDRSGCAAILTAIIERMRRGGGGPPAVVTFLIQEEIGLRGARYLDRDLVGRVDRAFNFDGGDPEKMTLGAPGGQRITMTIQGLPAHAGVAPETGISAIVIAGKAIASLAADGWLGRIERDGGRGTANIGIIRGGEATNVITPTVMLRAETRSHDAEFRQRIVDEIRSRFESAAAAETNQAGDCGRIEFESSIDYESFRLADDHPSLTAARRAIESVGRTPRGEIGGGGLDANWLFRHGIEAVTLGSGQNNIHTAEEYLDIAGYLDACRIATQLIA